MAHRFAIKVPDDILSRGTNLLPLLKNVLPLEFSAAPESAVGIAGEILTANTEKGEQNSEGKPTSFTLPSPNRLSLSAELTDLTVKFADEAEVPFPFRGRTIRVNVSASIGTLVLNESEQVLAASDSGPIWTISTKAGVKHFRSALPFPIMPPNGNLADVLHGGRFLEMLPFVHWVRGICASESYEGPAPRACFIFDDPNLHWPTYGFVDYKSIVSHAQKENYHVSFATIPLDSWFAHRQTVEIFRKNRAWLSLSVHGNNHSKGELGRVYSDAEASSLLYEAVQRIQGLERRTALSVSRVMIPPHGACSEQMLAALPPGGFEAACISHGSLRHHNKSREWTNALGFRPSELIQGCPVLPRWGFSGDPQNTILLAAYLKQAIILRGHHQDLKDGLDLLGESARIVNGLGSVQWLNMTEMVRSNYQWRIQGDLCRLKPLSRKIHYSVPAGVRKLQIDTSDSSFDAWQIFGPNGSTLQPSSEELMDLETDVSFSLEVACKLPVGTKKRPSPGGSVWLIRRLLTEGRDRLQTTWK
jgi:hypothetical protein